jgi:hypothetical protein
MKSEVSLGDCVHKNQLNCVHKNQLIDRILSQINAVHNFTPCSFKINVICFHVYAWISELVLSLMFSV